MATATIETTQPTTKSDLLTTVMLVLVTGCIWAILGMSFTLPEREDFNVVGEADWVGRLKLLARMGSFAVLVGICFFSLKIPRFKKVITTLTPFFLFLGLAIVSSRWSALRSVTLVQSFSLCLMLLIAVATATLVDTKEKARWVWLGLNGIFLARAAAMLFLEVTTGDGISRDNTSYWHATDGADTCGIGLLLLIGTHFFLRTKSSRLLLIPGLVIYAALFVIVQNRLIMILNPLLIMIMLMLTARGKIIFAAISLVAFGGPLLLVTDAYSGMFSELTGATVKFADRHDAESVGSFSGRDEMWAIVLEEFQYSPIIGHGFMVTSRKGEFECWYTTRNHDAHNQMLQVLVTTGFVGLSIFLVALLVPIRLALKNFKQHDEAKLMAFVFCWLLLWGLLNVSFSGYINASLITFYTVLGLCVAQFGIGFEDKNSTSGLTKTTER